MSAPSGKRERNEDSSIPVADDVNPAVKRIRIDHEDVTDSKLDSFLLWCRDGGLKLSQKVCVSKQGSCAQYGMMAVEDIDEGEVLFEIPRTLTLHPENSSIADILAKEEEELVSSSGWVPLLVTLMHEYTSPASHWKPYIHLVPDFKQLDLPMFWTREEREKELAGTGLVDAVERDLKSLTSEFNDVALPFIRKYPQVFSPECQDIGLYKKMVAFVMAYSFTEASSDRPSSDSDDDSDDDDDEAARPPMMVPMADILNHVSMNNANMIFGKDNLTMVAKCCIKKGEEVYNTYGCNSNSALLHMYGFAEKYPCNIYDTVEIPLLTLLEVCRSDELKVELKNLERKVKLLENLGLSDEHRFVMGAEGFLTEDETLQTLKVLTMSEDDLDQHKQNDGWEEDEDDNTSLSFENLGSVSSLWKKILLKTSESLLSCYPHNLKEEEEIQQQLRATLAAATAAGADLAGDGLAVARRLYSSYVRQGQLVLLERLVKVCSDC